MELASSEFSRHQWCTLSGWAERMALGGGGRRWGGADGDFHCQILLPASCQAARNGAARFSAGKIASRGESRCRRRGFPLGKGANIPFSRGNRSSCLAAAAPVWLLLCLWCPGGSGLGCEHVKSTFGSKKDRKAPCLGAACSPFWNL